MSGYDTHDTIVIGASAGGVEVLQALVSFLPASLPAAILVVLHRPPDQESLLPHIMRGAGPLPAADAEDGEAIRKGRIYVAPPDRHLLVEEGVLRLVRGPKENHARPAIDPLFRSAAHEFGPRVVGVILSGTLFDGTAGLFAVKRRGGVAVVQDPGEAVFPGMAESAIANVRVDHVLPVKEIAGLLTRLAGASIERREEDADMSVESEQLPEIILQDQHKQVSGGRHGQPSVFTCPECGGTLWQASAGKLIQLRCHVGHAYNAESFIREQDETLERSLWLALRLFKDKSLILRQLAERARRGEESAIAGRLEEKALTAEYHNRILRQVIEENGAALVAEELSTDGGE